MRGAERALRSARDGARARSNDEVLQTWKSPWGNGSGFDASGPYAAMLNGSGRTVLRAGGCDLGYHRRPTTEPVSSQMRTQFTPRFTLSPLDGGTEMSRLERACVLGRPLHQLRSTAMRTSSSESLNAVQSDELRIRGVTMQTGSHLKSVERTLAHHRRCGKPHPRPTRRTARYTITSAAIEQPLLSPIECHIVHCRTQACPESGSSAHPSALSPCGARPRARWRSHAACCAHCLQCSRNAERRRRHGWQRTGDCRSDGRRQGHARAF